MFGNLTIFAHTSDHWFDNHHNRPYEGASGLLVGPSLVSWVDLLQPSSNTIDKCYLVFSTQKPQSDVFPYIYTIIHSTSANRCETSHQNISQTISSSRNGLENMFHFIIIMFIHHGPTISFPILQFLQFLPFPCFYCER